MDNKKQIVINLKSNLSLNDTYSYLKQLELIKDQNINQFVFCLNHLSLFLTEFIHNPLLNFCTQSFSGFDLGAYTACNNLKQILEFKNINYCLLNHCEEIKYCNINNTDTNLKLKGLVDSKLNCIVCFSESINSLTELVDNLVNVVETLLKDVNHLNNICLAYEPIAAVNTNLEINAEQINTLFKELRLKLNDKFKHQFKLFYGGNVNQSNLESFLSQEQIDGLLIGRYGVDLNNIFTILKLLK